MIHFQKAMKYLSVLMAFIYFVLGIYLLVQPEPILGLAGRNKIILSIVLMAYGLFRAVMTYQKHFKNTNDENLL
jgi:uncharacterized membrane protein